MFYGNYQTGFKSGMRVRVVRQHKYKNTDLIGKFGTVKSGEGIEVSVKIDGMVNPYSGGGHYYFKPSEIEIIDEHNNIIIEEKNNMPKITNYVNVVKIRYLDNHAPSGYVYANFNPDIKIGDMCVIKSKDHGLGLAKVVEVIDRTDYEISSREVVAIVDTSDYDERVAARTKAAELLTTMQERAKKLQNIALYQMLAESDPEMAELLNEYKKLSLA